MAQIGEVTFLPKEAPREGCLPWWLWCTPSTICLHGAGASGRGESGPHHLPPSRLTSPKYYTAPTFTRTRSCRPRLLYLPLRLGLRVLQLQGQSLGALRRHRCGGVPGLQADGIHQAHVSVCPPRGSAGARDTQADGSRAGLGTAAPQSPACSAPKPGTAQTRACRPRPTSTVASRCQLTCTCPSPSVQSTY